MNDWKLREGMTTASRRSSAIRATATAHSVINVVGRQSVVVQPPWGYGAVAAKNRKPQQTSDCAQTVTADQTRRGPSTRSRSISHVKKATTSDPTVGGRSAASATGSKDQQLPSTTSGQPWTQSGVPVTNWTVAGSQEVSGDSWCGPMRSDGSSTCSPSERQSTMVAGDELRGGMSEKLNDAEGTREKIRDQSDIDSTRSANTPSSTRDDRSTSTIVPDTIASSRPDCPSTADLDNSAEITSRTWMSTSNPVSGLNATSPRGLLTPAAMHKAALNAEWLRQQTAAFLDASASAGSNGETATSDPASAAVESPSDLSAESGSAADDAGRSLDQSAVDASTMAAARSPASCPELPLPPSRKSSLATGRSSRTSSVCGRSEKEHSSHSVRRGSAAAPPATMISEKWPTERVRACLMVGMLQVKNRHKGVMVDCPIIETIDQPTPAEASTSKTHKVVLIKAVVPRSVWNSHLAKSGGSSVTMNASGSTASVSRTSSGARSSSTNVKDGGKRKKSRTSKDAQTSTSGLTTAIENESPSSPPAALLPSTAVQPAVEDCCQLSPSSRHSFKDLTVQNQQAAAEASRPDVLSGLTARSLTVRSRSSMEVDSLMEDNIDEQLRLNLQFTSSSSSCISDNGSSPQEHDHPDDSVCSDDYGVIPRGDEAEPAPSQVGDRMGDATTSADNDEMNDESLTVKQGNPSPHRSSKTGGPTQNSGRGEKRPSPVGSSGSSSRRRATSPQNTTASRHSPGKSPMTSSGVDQQQRRRGSQPRAWRQTGSTKKRSEPASAPGNALRSSLSASASELSSLPSQTAFYDCPESFRSSARSHDQRASVRAVAAAAYNDRDAEQPDDRRGRSAPREHCAPSPSGVTGRHVPPRESTYGGGQSPGQRATSGPRRGRQSTMTWDENGRSQLYEKPTIAGKTLMRKPPNASRSTGSIGRDSSHAVDGRSSIHRRQQQPQQQKYSASARSYKVSGSESSAADLSAVASRRSAVPATDCGRRRAVSAAVESASSRSQDRPVPQQQKVSRYSTSTSVPRRQKNPASRDHGRHPAATVDVPTGSSRSVRDHRPFFSYDKSPAVIESDEQQQLDGDATDVMEKEAEFDNHRDPHRSCQQPSTTAQRPRHCAPAARSPISDRFSPLRQQQNSSTIVYCLDADGSPKYNLPSVGRSGRLFDGRRASPNSAVRSPTSSLVYRHDVATGQQLYDVEATLTSPQDASERLPVDGHHGGGGSGRSGGGSVRAPAPAADRPAWRPF